MLEIKTTKQKRVHTISLFAALGVLGTVLVVWAGTGITQKIISERQDELIKKLRSNVADSPSFLAEKLFEMQERSISLFLPGMPNPVCFSSGLFSFDPATFPKAFLKGMVYEVEYGSPVYHLRLREVRATREIEILDADGKVFYVIQPDTEYDPLWLARRKHPEIFKEDGNPSQRAFMLECMEPSHVEMSISLIPVTYVEIYAEERIASLLDVMLAKDRLSVASSKLSGMAMMRMAGSDTNIVVAQIAVGGTGILLRVDYPDTLTNRLEVLVSTNLVDQHWWVVETNLVTTGTNSLEWLDVSLTNLAGVPPRFYQIGNSVDHDGDGLEDGREVIIYHTDPNSRDSDGDGLTDGAEVLSWGTNPNNPDSDGDLFPDGWETQNGYDPASAQTWNLADGKVIITSTYTQWNNTFHCNSIDYSCPFNAINNVITKQVKGVVWSDAITNVLLIVGGDKYGNRLRRYTAPVVNRQFTTDMPLLPGYNYIQAYAGCEVSNVCYYIGTDKFLMSLVVDAQPTNTLRMEFDSTINPSITNRPLFDVIIQQGTYNGFSTPCSWVMQRNGLNDFPTASWAYYPWGSWDGSTRSINISPVSGMIRVDVHDVSQNRGTHSDTLRVLMNNEVISEEVRTGLSNFITNDYHRYDTAMKGGVWAYHNRSCGGFTVDGDKNITLLPQMAQVGYHYQPPLDGGPYGDSMFRESNGVSGTTTTWPYEWCGMTNMVLTGPNGNSPVYLKYGESAQFSATGTVMLNTPGLWVTTNYPGLGIVNCFSGPDGYGVYNGYKPGQTNITCSGNSSTIEVFVAGSPVAVSIQAAMDANRDLQIDLSGTNDVGATVFWLNDDVDVISGGEEDDTESGATNCNDNAITCKRDLEDFTRLHIKVDAITANISGITYVLKFENVTSGAPEVNIFEAVNESLGYLSDSSQADQQIQKTKLITVSATETNLPNQYIKTGSQVSPFILEGKSAGKGDLTLIIKVHGTEVCRKSFPLELHPIKWFYDIYKTDIVPGSDSNQWTVTMQTYSNANVASYTPEKNDYLLFVHGWNMAEWEKERWAETVFKRLWWQRYKGKVGLFSWPTLSGFWWGDAWYNTHHFDASEFRSWLCASNLASCFTALNVSGQLRVLAHSMGNVVAGEALRQYSGTALQTYIASQAAMSANYYDTTDTIPAIQQGFAWPPVFCSITTPNIIGHYNSATTNVPPYHTADALKATNWCNYYNADDYALRGNHWELDSASKPDNWTPLFFDYEGSLTNYNETQDHFYRWLNPDHDNLTVTVDRQRYAIFSYCAESRVQALGCIAPAGWNVSFDLQSSPLNYNAAHYAHSRQFRSNVVDERNYWEHVMTDCGFTP